MPRAIIADEFGPPESYRLAERDPGHAGAGQVRVAIKAAGISYVDVLMAMGKYQMKPPLPVIPGSEFSGIVEEVGEGVTHLAVGDAVFGSEFGSVFAEAGVFKAKSLARLPDGMRLDEAALLPVNYLTAYYALADRGRARPGETLLVLGAAGGTGFAAVQVGKLLGLRVIASASSEAKRQAALAGGADAAVASGAEDWREQIRAANDGKPVDIVFDPVGGEATDLAFRTLGYDGRHLVIGFPAGMTALKTNLPLLKMASLVGVDVRGHGIARPEESAAYRKTVAELAGQGKFHPAIAARYPMEDYAAAMNEAYSGKAAGRIVLIMGDGGK